MGAFSIEVESWLAACLGRPVLLTQATRLTAGSGCVVADCVYDGGTGVLKVYHPRFDDYSGIGPLATARKYVLALLELPEHGVWVPRLLGSAVDGEEAAVLVERLDPIPPLSEVDQAATELLSRLHGIQVSVVSPELASLILQSRPNRRRVWTGIRGMSDRLDQVMPSWRTEEGSLVRRIEMLTDSGEPVVDNPTLVHGDYFSVNFLRNSNNQLAVIDWDLLSLGDPMWDLAFLIGADPTLQFSARRETIEAAYKAPVQHNRLDWHVASWDLFWGLKTLLKGRP